MANLFSWLAEGKSKSSFSVTYNREHPDKLQFTVGEDVPRGGFLLWKEAYYPDFHAQLAPPVNGQASATDLRTYRAGPGFVLIKAPELKRGDKIIYEYRQPFSEKASLCFSLLTFLLLPAILVEGALLREKSAFLRSIKLGEGKIYHLLFELWKKPFTWWRKGEEE